MWQVGTIAGNEVARNTPNQMAIGVLVGQLVGLPQTFEGTENSMSHYREARKGVRENWPAGQGTEAAVQFTP